MILMIIEVSDDHVVNDLVQIGQGVLELCALGPRLNLYTGTFDLRKLAIVSHKGVLAIRRIFSLVDMMTKPKF